MLTRLAHSYQRLVFFVVAVLMGFGAYSYFTLPAQEDPQITIREAIVTTAYPGLSPERVEQLVTKPLERAIRQIPEVEEIRSSSLPGTSIIHVEVFDRFFELDQIWDDLRAEVELAQADLPDGARPSVVSDDVGDVAVVTAALRSTDHDLAELGDMVNHVRDRLYGEAGVKSIDVVGRQPERIYIETRNARLAELGISPDAITATLANQNIIRPGGQIDIGPRALIIEPTGDYRSLEQIAETLISLPDGTSIPLRDIARIERSLVDPAPQSAFYNGDPAIVFAIAMQEGNNVLEFGPRIAEALDEIEAGLPVGMTLDIVTFQPDQVEQAVHGVTINVLQTLGIVLAVVVLLLGLRTGLIVGAIVPLVMLSTLAVMGFLGLPLERMSLATLVIALGLLVDAGVVVAEDFKARLSDGADKDEALERTGRELSLPLLSSTATTILVFLPLMLAEHVAGEYTRSISIVVAIALSISWLLAMTVTPVLSHRFATAETDGARPYYERMFDPLVRGYGRLIEGVLKVRGLFVGTMLAGLAGGAALVVTSPQSFFPDSDRAQLITYVYLPADVTTEATEAEMAALLPTLTPERFDWLEDHAAYVGTGGPRFVLSLTPVDPAPNRAVLIMNVDDPANVDRAMDELRDHLAAEFAHLQAHVTRMFLGPTDSAILEVQVKGPDRAFVYETASRVEEIIATVPGARDIRQDWENRIPRVVVHVDQTRARRAGVTSADVARSMSAYFSGRAVSEFREGDDTIPIVARAVDAERTDLDRVRSLSVFGQDGSVVPLMQVADVELVNGYARIEREGLTRTVTVQGRSEVMGAEDMAPLIEDDLDALRAELPPGHTIEFDGILVQSGEGRAALLASMPLCLAVVVVLLIAQFNSFRRPAIILATVPLVVLGAGLGLRLFDAEFGFMPILGLLSLAGIILNNAIVLIDRIDIERAEGREGDDAIVEAAKRRLRPIVMTTVTTILGLLPLILSNDPLFYGMAVVMAGGLAVGTVLTLGFVPVLYSLFFAERGARVAARRQAA
ncbi:efflux RND transporter permease subunit [Jannaschia aquimarina]|uniref:MdtB_1 protein n=1 Tax=Jannaschia aquimarina TaxID=935700 RepID=A0A0D1CQ70_9RHOB|nr:efflux RND transporter permease subunit [Jannaschia aquimarina]KIT16897.1 Multidrug resistance protein MdtB [Jannaschia aquimarina]SNT12079.1 Multidrug efflux pump subunit AcrB [Jannaschia aquimarina]